MKYMVAAPDLSGSELAYAIECLRSSWISSRGRFLDAFEAAVATHSSRRHAVATCNGTVALHLALAGLGLGEGDEVIVPDLTYVATANAVRYCGATPVFADADPATWCVSVDSVARLITPRTRGIIPVHLYGHVCDLGPLLALARRHGLWVVEDAAEAQGATYDGQPAGSFGDAAVFSFFGNKLVTTGEGGAVVTDDDALARRLRLLRGQGMDPERRYWHSVLGFNYRMTNLAAAIGLAQMERVGRLVGARVRVAGWYEAQLQDAPLTLPPRSARVGSVYWLYSVLVEDARLRDPLMAGLAEAGIETRPFFYPLHQFPMYQGGRTDGGCPAACDLSARGLSLPTSPALEEKDVAAIAAEVKRALRRLRAVAPLRRSCAA
jgi:perosamine synthetase